MKINELYNLDCEQGMELLYKENGQCIDCILTDPPYNLSMKNNFKSMNRTGLDYGTWDKDFDLTRWLTPALKLLKDGGNIIIFNDWRNLDIIGKELERQGCEVKSLIIWVKTNPMPRNRDRRYSSTCEFAIWATKSKKKKWTFNRQKETYENGLFHYAVPCGKRRIHTTQKPDLLIQDILKIHTNENDMILDPFSGSGVISANAYLLNRNFVAFELDKEIYIKSKEIILKDIIK